MQYVKWRYPADLANWDVTRQTSGTIQLAKPNRGRITLHGDYPQVLLVSNGRTRYLASPDGKFQEAPIDAKGTGLDSPWWGLPFRFFFTLSINPFGGAADPTATYSELESRSGESNGPSVPLVQSSSPVGSYTEKLFFNAAGDLIESSVQFGDGPGAALFQAKLTDIRHGGIANESFRFTPKAGQVAKKDTDAMLPLGAAAPSFILPTPDGTLVHLDQQLRGKRAVLVNFWYYNCAPCRIEFPQFESLYKQFADQGFTIIAVDKGDSPAVVSKYVGTAGLTFPVVLGGNVSKRQRLRTLQGDGNLPGNLPLRRARQVPLPRDGGGS